MALDIIDKETFGSFCSQVEYKSFIQSIEMAELLQKRGYQTQYLAISDQKDIKVAAILYSVAMAGGLRMEINSGPVVADTTYTTAFYKVLQDYAKQQGALELVIKPYDTYQTFTSDGHPNDDEKPELIKALTKLNFTHDGLLTGYPNGEGDWHYVKELSGLTSANLIKSFSKKGKALLKKAKTFGIKLHKLSRDELTQFKAITAATSSRRDYTDKPLSYYQDFYDSFGDSCEFMVATLNFDDYLANLRHSQDRLKQGMAKLEADLAKNPRSEKKQNRLRELSSQFDTFQVRVAEAQELIIKYGKKDVPLAGSLFVYTPQEAVYLFSGSYPEFNRFYAPALLQEHVMLRAIEKGISCYNFLGIMGEFDGSDGVLRFKQNFNGYITRKMGTFRYYPKPFKYKAIQAIKTMLGRS